MLGAVRSLARRHPLAFNCVTYGSICGAAEATQQKIQDDVSQEGNRSGNIIAREKDLMISQRRCQKRQVKVNKTKREH